MNQPEFIQEMAAFTKGGERMVPEAWEGDESVITSHFRHWRKVAGLLTRGVPTLDVGCGCGMGSRIYSLATGARVVAIDRPEVAAMAAKLYSTPGVLFCGCDLRTTGDLLRVPYLLEFGNVVCMDLLEHLEDADYDRTLRDMANVGKPEAHYWLSVPIKPDGVDKCSWHRRTWPTKKHFLSDVGRFLDTGRITFV